MHNVTENTLHVSLIIGKANTVVHSGINRSLFNRTHEKPQTALGAGRMLMLNRIR